jgi:hypothetical protein
VRSYGNVMSTLAVFLLLAGGTAFAANQLAKNSVGKKQLKANAVVTAKIKKNAVTKAKIRDGAVDASKIAAGSLTGADLAASSMPYTQVTSRIRSTAQVPFTEDVVYPIGGYAQAAGEDSQYIAALDVHFPAACTPPRGAVGYLLSDAANPAEPELHEAIGIGFASDEAGGEVTKKLNFTSVILSQPMQRAAPQTAEQHTFTFRGLAVGCGSGGGVTIEGGSVDVIGTR